jgi:inhibitor of KinA
MPASAAADPQFTRASDQSLLVYFDRQISLAAHEKVRKLLRLLEIEPIPGIRNLHPAYCSILITFDPFRLTFEALQSTLTNCLSRLPRVALLEPRTVEIPVCYGGEYGPDLNEVSALHGIAPAEVVELHTSVTYVVYFLGFVPGFAYLGELPPTLATPRLPTPRRAVPAGSVGIAGTQTGVYPFTTPGGWRLLGRTPIRMFRADHNDLSLLRIGDRVRFLPISRDRFAGLEHA